MRTQTNAFSGSQLIIEIFSDRASIEISAAKYAEKLIPNFDLSLCIISFRNFIFLPIRQQSNESLLNQLLQVMENSLAFQRMTVVVVVN